MSRRDRRGSWTDDVRDDDHMALPSCWKTDDERKSNRSDYTQIEPADPDTAREHSAYWVMVYDTGTQRKGLHLPTEASTRDDPEMRCERTFSDDGSLRPKPLAAFPPGYAPERICTNCRRELALALRGDDGVE